MTTMEDLMSRVPVDARGEEEDHQSLMVTTAPRLRAAMASTLNRRTGHARFRRGPVVPSPGGTPSAKSTEAVTTPCDGFSAPASSSHPSTTLTSVTAGGEGSVSGGNHVRWFAPATAAHAAGWPPPVQSASDGARGWLDENSWCDDDRARSENNAAGGKARGGRCHCSKKRKSRVKTVVRMPAISSRNTHIPPDDYPWRKYGQKPIKGSPYPRGYYKCSTVRGCPARKHVERDPRQPAMLIVTYESDHRHDDARPLDQGTASITPAA
jgi:hypothetical protein